ncbi:MAG: phytanoyl-CoA dioxygenase family protein [Planctomycetota bacterium]|nr:phytanoyl-CoA dioxygenase family protein [Planctomycetota bacterium]
MLVAASRKAAFEKDGYIVVEDLFPGEYMQEAKAEVRRVLDAVNAECAARGEKPRNKANGVYVGLSLNSGFFKRFNADPRLVDILEDLVGPNLEFWSDKIVFKSAGVDFGSPWHQDWQYWHGANKYSLWIALDDATRENGCLKVLPGSHTRVFQHGGRDEEGIGFGNRMRKEDIDESKAVDLPARAGTAVFFHDLLLHASYPNTTGRDRWALIPTYRDASKDDYDYGFAQAAFMVRGQRTGKSLGVKG